MTSSNHADHFVRLALGVVGACFVVMCLACGGGGLNTERGGANDKPRDAVAGERSHDGQTPQAHPAGDKAGGTGDRVLDAKQFAKNSVLRLLKHADDSGFGAWDDPEVKFNAEQDTFLLSSRVTVSPAKDEAGVGLTHKWEAIVMLDGATWELASCSIDGNTVYSSGALLDKVIAAEQGRGEAAKK